MSHDHHAHAHGHAADFGRAFAIGVGLNLAYVAVEAGYGKAFPSILDGHVTVFISGLILAQYGTGPVKGFAVTLIVGIVASLFTGVFCTRLVFDWWVRHAKVKRLSVGAEF